MVEASERDSRSFRRRTDVIGLPMTPLRNDGYLAPSRKDASWNREPAAVGIGPEGEAWAVWTAHQDPHRQLVTRHTSRTEPDLSVQIDSSLEARFVQPLPDGEILIVSARKRSEHTAQVWNASGALVREADFGDAIEHVLTTPTGAVWVGYFDEALGGSGPQTHGLARFDSALELDWLYPIDAHLPPVYDCMALNIHGEMASICAYRSYHLIQVRDDEGRDLGPTPHPGADSLLIDGTRAVLIGGYQAEYDLVTPIRQTQDGFELATQPCRLVLPDGLELRNRRVFCRGATMWVVVGATKYLIDLDQLVGTDL